VGVVWSCDGVGGVGEVTPLKSPTCSECAKSRGFVPVTEIMTVYEDECANCGKRKPVSTSYDWKRPGERRAGGFD